MSNSARSLFAFAVYLVLMGVTLIVMPNLLLTLFGIPETGEVWIRVVGILALFLAFYYALVARHEMTRFIQWTVYARSTVILFFTAFVVLGLAPATLILFGVVDLLAALWTAVALRSEGHQLTL